MIIPRILLSGLLALTCAGYFAKNVSAQVLQVDSLSDKYSLTLRASPPIQLGLSSAVWMDGLGVEASSMAITHRSGDILIPETTNTQFLPPLRTTVSMTVHGESGLLARHRLLSPTGQQVAASQCGDFGCHFSVNLITRDGNAQPPVSRLAPGRYTLITNFSDGRVRQHVIELR